MPHAHRTRSLREVTEERIKRRKKSRAGKGIFKTLAALRAMARPAPEVSRRDAGVFSLGPVSGSLRSAPHANAPRAGHEEGGTLEVGRTMVTPRGIKIHRFVGLIEVTDLTNAGKRGKTVRSLRLHSHSHNESVIGSVFGQAVRDILPLSYDEAKRMLARVAETSGGMVTLTEAEKRGVDVEPAATKIDLRHEDAAGTILTIEASPNDFHVRHSRLLVPRVGPKKDHELRDDMGYWPAKKKDAQKFYAWAVGHLSAIEKMSIGEIKDEWRRLGVQWDSH